MASNRIDTTIIPLPLELTTHLNTQKTIAQNWLNGKTPVFFQGKWRTVVKNHLFLKGDPEDQKHVTDLVIKTGQLLDRGKRFVVVEFEDGECCPIYNITKAKYGKRKEMV